MLYKSTLPKTGESYEIFLQSADDIPAILDLQKKIYDDLSDDEKVFIVPKDEAFFQKHFAHGNMVIGVRSGGRLIGQSIIVNPSTDFPKNGMTDMALARDAAPEKITVLQGVLVDPAYRGNQLMTKMVSQWLKLSAKAGRCHAIAEVAVGNVASWLSFIREGIAIESVGYDPDDKIHLYNMHGSVPALRRRRAKADFNKAAAKGTRPCPVNDIDGQKALLAKGYVATAYDIAGQKLLFKKRSKRHLSCK